MTIDEIRSLKDQKSIEGIYKVLLDQALDKYDEMIDFMGKELAKKENALKEAEPKKKPGRPKKEATEDLKDIATQLANMGD